MFTRLSRFFRKWMTDQVFLLALGVGSAFNLIFITASSMVINRSSLNDTAVDEWSGVVGLSVHALMIIGFYFWGNAGYPRPGRRLPRTTSKTRLRERELLREARIKRSKRLELTQEQARAHARNMLLSDVERVARDHYGMNVFAATMAAHEAMAVLEERVK